MVLDDLLFAHRPLRVGMDIDEVVADFCHPYWDLLCKIEGVYMSYVQPKKWHWEHEYFSEATRVEAWRILKGHKTKREMNEFWDHLPVVCPPADLLTLRILQERHNLYFLTARPDATKAITEHWLGKQLLVSRSPTVIMCSRSKGLLVRELDLDCMFDDRGRNLAANHYGFLIDRPWNQDMDPDVSFMRVPDITQGIMSLDARIFERD